jgi:putative spermidine/putrescine transport system permease protein
VQRWPIQEFSTEWFSKAFHNPGVRDALLTSLKAGLGATAIALVLGTLASYAVARYRFFGRDTISFLVVLRSRSPGS